MSSFRDRLVRFYEVHNPSCLSSVDAILATYHGREDELMRVLVNKYGEEPGTTAEQQATATAPGNDGTLAADNVSGPSVTDGSPSTSVADSHRPPQPFLPPHVKSREASARTSPQRAERASPSTSLQDRVVRMLVRYKVDGHLAMQPSAVRSLPLDEAQTALNSLIREHGPEPPATPDGQVDWRAVLGGFMEERCPSEINKLDALLENFAGRERDVLAALTRRYPTDGPTRPRARSSRNASEQRNPAAATAAAASGAPGRDSANPPPNASLTPEERRALSQRLHRFYSVHQPAKIESIDLILGAYRGRPEDLIAQLVAKYGPEPTTAEGGGDAGVDEALRELGPTPPPSGTDPRLSGTVTAETSFVSDAGTPAAAMPQRDGRATNRPTAARQETRKRSPVAPTTKEEPRRAAPTSEAESQRREAHPPSQHDAPADMMAVPQPISREQQAVPASPSASTRGPRMAPPPDDDPPRDAHRGHGHDELEAPAAAAVGASRRVPPPASSTSSAPRPSHAQVLTSDLEWPARFYNMYSYYRPDKILSLGEKLRAHHGREAEWMSLLIGKYGMEPPPRSGYVASDSPDDEFEAEVRALFQHHDPAMLEFVPYLCADPTIARREFLHDLRVRYGLRPSVRRESRFVSPDRHAPQQAADDATRSQSQVDEGAAAATGASAPRPQQSPPGAPQRVQDMEQAIAELSAALDLKTGELQQLARKAQQAVEDRAMLEIKVDEMTKTQRDLEDQITRLKALCRDHESSAKEHAASREKTAALENELLVARQQTAQGSSTVAVREHQNRVLRMQLQQLSAELEAKDDSIKVLLQRQQAAAESLSDRLADIAALQLDLTPSSDPEKFYAVVDDIKEAFRTHYAECVKEDEAQMREYYEYAEKQIANREAIVDELLDALAATMKPPTTVAPGGNGAPPAMHADASEGTTGEERTNADAGNESTAAELARLRTMLAVQHEEHKALVQAMALRQHASQLTSPRVRVADDVPPSEASNASALRIDTTRASVLEESRAVREIKGQLEQQRAEGRAMQASMAAEIQRYVSDMKAMHERMLQMSAAQQEDSRRAAELDEEVTRLRGSRVAVPGLSPLSPSSEVRGDVDGAARRQEAMSPTSAAEERAARALADSKKLLDAAADASRQFTEKQPAAQSPPPVQQSSIASGAGPSPATQASPREAPDPQAPTARWAPPRLGTVWGMMYGQSDGTSGAEGSPAPTRPAAGDYFAPSGANAPP